MFAILIFIDSLQILKKFVYCCKIQLFIFQNRQSFYLTSKLFVLEIMQIFQMYFDF
jgi:hypothetical protein